jgi:hypothetical protein
VVSQVLVGITIGRGGFAGACWDFDGGA